MENLMAQMRMMQTTMQQQAEKVERLQLEAKPGKGPDSTIDGAHFLRLVERCAALERHSEKQEEEVSLSLTRPPQNPTSLSGTPYRMCLLSFLLQAIEMRKELERVEKSDAARCMKLEGSLAEGLVKVSTSRGLGRKPHIPTAALVPLTM